MDAILIDRIQEGDANAMDDLLNRYKARIYQYAFRLTRNADDASDLLSETFIRAYGALARFHRGSSLTTWFCKIVRNCFLDTLKKSRFKNTLSIDQVLQQDDFCVFPQIVDKSADVEGIAISSAVTSELLDLVDELRPQEATLVRMYCLNGLTYEEISRRLNVPVGTIKSRLYRARAHLQKKANLVA
jgi:RNA polymerase sigma-70 factor (ECF subfamily)